MVSLAGTGWRIDGIAGVLFDKDGTLIDSHAYWGRIICRRGEAILRRYSLGRELFPGICRSMGLSLETGRLLPEGPVALVTREEVIGAVARFLAGRGVEAAVDDLSAVFYREHEAFLPEIHEYVRILPGVRELLAGLRDAGIATAVVTTDTVVNTVEILDRHGLGRFFDAVVGKETTPEAKVTGVPARKALELIGVPAGSAVAVGDAPMDLEMAARAGLLAGIGVASGQIPLQTLREQTPYVAGSLTELAAA